MLSENSLYTRRGLAAVPLAPDRRRRAQRVALVFPRPARARSTGWRRCASARCGRAASRDPRDHIVIVRNMHLANKPETPDGVGTLLRRAVGRSPTAELDRARRCRRRAAASRSCSARAVAADDDVRPADRPATISRVRPRAYPINIAPPTDDSPFFFNMLRLRDSSACDLLDCGQADAQHEGGVRARRAARSP